MVNSKNTRSSKTTKTIQKIITNIEHSPRGVMDDGTDQRQSNYHFLSKEKHSGLFPHRKKSDSHNTFTHLASSILVKVHFG